LRRAELSRIRIVTLRGLADAIAAGSLDLDGLTHAPEEEIHARLTALKGIGPWTADIYILFCLARADAWSPGDLALQYAVRDAPPLSSTPVRASRRWSRSPKPGGRGEASPRVCFGRIMG
jgi:DNA-3-methyladenine glycosylase II